MRHKHRVKSLGVATLLTFIFSLFTVTAQESVNATGGAALGNGGSAHYTVGQVACQTHTGINASVAEGVQQSYQISVISGIEEAKDINLSVAAYPNPTTDFLTLEFEGEVKTQYIASLYDINGNLLQSEKITGKQTRINMSNLVPATYFVKVVKISHDLSQQEVHHVKSNEVGAKQFNVVKSFKVIKTQ